MENAIFSAGSDPKPPFHGGGRSRKVSLRFEKSALFRSHGRCWLRSIKHWKTHACFFRLNYNYLFVKETASFDHYFCDHRWLFISGWFLWFLLLPLQADTKVTIGGILCENPQNSAHGYFNTTWGQFKLQHSLLLQLWGFTWLHYLRLTSNTFLLDPDVFLIPKKTDFLDCLEPKNSSNLMRHQNQHQHFSFLGLWDEMHQSFLWIQRLHTLGCFFFRILYMFFVAQGTCSKLAYIPSMGGHVTTISTRPSRGLVLHAMTVMTTQMYIFLSWIVFFQ